MILIDVNFCSDCAARITISRKQNIKLQKLLHEKPVGKRKFTDLEVRKNAMRLKIPAVKIRYWLKQRNAFDEGSKSCSLPVGDAVDERCKLLNEISFDKKVLLLKKTISTTILSTRLTRELSRELQIDENRIFNWLKYKVERNLQMKKSLAVDEITALNAKFAELDYLDDDTTVVLADRFNVPAAVIKKTFQQLRPTKGLPTPVVHIKKLPVAALSSVAPPKDVRSSPKLKPAGSKKNLSFKTVDQKNILFEAFCQSPTLTKNDTVAELVNATGLMPLQITKWLSVFRAKWAQNSESGLKKVLMRGLSQYQLVELEKMYRGNRFMTTTQLKELSKTIGLPLRVLQAWFSNRRIYEIRSCDKDLANIGPKIVVIRKESCQSLQSQQQLAAQAVDHGGENNAKFFESLNKTQKAHLKAACKSYNVSYTRLAQTMGVSAEKIKQYIVSYRIRNSMFRQTARSMPERIHKALLNHVMKFGKISSKTSVALAKRLKMRPEQVYNWSRTHSERILEHNRSPQQTANTPAPQTVTIVPAVSSRQAVAEYYEDTEPAMSAAQPKSSAKKSLLGTKYSVPSFAKIMLLEEFKKSPQAVVHKSKQLANMVGLTQNQVRKWIYNFTRKIGQLNKSEVVARVNNPAITDEIRARLEAEYRRRRYLDLPEMEALAAKLGLSRRQLESWFINARYYEVLTGQCPGSDDESATLKCTIESKSFYESLSVEQRAHLHDELNSHSFNDKKLDNLAHELQVSSNELKNWFYNASPIQTRRLSSPNPMLPLNLTPKALEILINEFEVDPILPDSRAGTLAKRIKVTKDRIKAWFANRQEEMQKLEHKIPPIRITIPKYNITSNGDSDFESSKKSYFQQNRLFDEFKMNPTLTDQRLVEISEDTNLDSKQISAWFDWMKSKLASIPRDSLLEENRNRNLTTRQISILEEEYTKNRYVDRSVRESISRSLGVPKNVVKSWFANKRYSEILCQNGSVDSDPLSSQDGDYDENDDVTYDETVIGFEWDEETTIINNSEFEHKLDVKGQGECDPLNEYSFAEEPDEDVKTNISYNFQLSPNSAFTDDLTSLPYQPRNRVFVRLDKDLEPLDGDVERLFWFVRKTPNKIDKRFDQDIDEEKNRVLENELRKTPWQDSDTISRLSAQLLVSEPKIHWWFMKKRVFITKTIPDAPLPKSKPKSASNNFLIDLTGDDSESQSSKCGEFEFITLDETPQIKEENEQLTEDDNSEIGDPFENQVIEEQSTINEEPSQDPIITDAIEHQSSINEPSQDPINTIYMEEQSSINESSQDPIDRISMEEQLSISEPSQDPIDTTSILEQSSINVSSQDPIYTKATEAQSSINESSQDPIDRISMEEQLLISEPSQDPIDTTSIQEQSSINVSSQDPIYTKATEAQSSINESSQDPTDRISMEEQLSISEPSQDPIYTTSIQEQSSINVSSQDPIYTKATEAQSSINDSSQDSIKTKVTEEQLPINEPSQDPIVTHDPSTNSTTVSPTNSTSVTKKKKTKTVPLTSHQRALLKQEFKRNKTTSNSQARFLAQDLGLSVSRIESWFKNMRNKQKTVNPSEISASVKNLRPEIETGLEEEYLKSGNLSNKRAKLIAIKMNTKKKIVQKWFVERAKRKDEQTS